MKRLQTVLSVVLISWITIACAPLTPPTSPPLDQVATRAVEVRATATAQPPLPTLPQATPTPEPRAQSQETPTPLPTVQPVFGEPAGCRMPAETETYAQRMAYVAQIFPSSASLAKLRLDFAWNAKTSAYERASEFAASFSVADLQPAYRVQELLGALHAAGFAAWLRNDPKQSLNILAVALRPGVLDSIWGDYVRAYWIAPDSTPADDTTVLTVLKLSPCRWMVSQGYAPDLPAGQIEAARWTQPDFVTAGQPFLAATTDEANRIAREIDWLSNSDGESPVLMCGPLVWAILNRAGAFPPGYGAWLDSPISFWLPKPSENGRPWSLFDPELYSVARFSDPIGDFDFSRIPLHPGDIVYTYSGGDGFDHILVVTEEDPAGKRYTVSNLIKTYPVIDYSIRRMVIYDSADDSAGAFRNEWSKDLRNGRTGHKGFEVFRWNWREKDISGKAQTATVLPGDTLTLIAARWRTPPLLIAAANSLDPTVALKVGAQLQIPPNAAP